MRLYPEGHNFRQSAYGEFQERLQETLRVTGLLRLRVLEGELLLDDQSAYSEPNLKENVARRLFLDGVRELTIHEGVSTEESQALIEVLYEGLANQEADITNLLNDAELTRVDFEATSALAEAWEPPDYLSGRALDVIESMNADVDQLVSKLTHDLKGSPLEFELSDGGRETKEAAVAEDTEVGEAAAADLYPLDPAALESFRADLARWGPQEMLVTVVETCLAAVAAGSKAVLREDAGWLLRESLAGGLRSRDLQFVVHLLNRLEQERYSADEDDEAFFSELMAWVQSDVTVERIAELGRTGFLGGPEAFVNLIQRLGDAGADVALYVFRDGSEEALNDRLLKYLGELVPGNPNGLAPLLQEDVPGPKAKSALFLLSKKAPQDADLTELLDLAKAHPDPKVSEYAEHLWRSLTEAGRWKKSVDGLANPSRYVRLKALQDLIDARVAAAAPAVQAQIESDEFLSRDHDERHAFMLALTVLDKELAGQVLASQTERKSWLRNRQASRETASLARDVLQQMLEEGES